MKRSLPPSGTWAREARATRSRHRLSQHRQQLLAHGERRHLRGGIIGGCIGVGQPRLSCLHFHLAGSASASRALCRRDWRDVAREAVEGGVDLFEELGFG